MQHRSGDTLKELGGMDVCHVMSLALPDGVSSCLHFARMFKLPDHMCVCWTVRMFCFFFQVGGTLLHLAHGVEVVRMMISRGADVNARTDVSK